jgi:hypothetical protein
MGSQRAPFFVPKSNQTLAVAIGKPQAIKRGNRKV